MLGSYLIWSRNLPILLLRTWNHKLQISLVVHQTCSRNFPVLSVCLTLATVHNVIGRTCHSSHYFKKTWLLKYRMYCSCTYNYLIINLVIKKWIDSFPHICQSYKTLMHTAPRLWNQGAVCQGLFHCMIWMGCVNKILAII